MKYISLFSGFGGAELAFSPLGWECVAVSEIDPAACSVLRHHWPNVPNLGDITKITQEQVQSLGHIDLVIGGFPCQDVSIAGKRAGLKNKDGEATRSGLFFDAMRIVRWSRARWTIIENVPGLFSSNDGADFATVVGEMVGLRINVPRSGWRNAGVFSGPDGLTEWAVLDAQFFGVPQRRRRVFFVRDTGKWYSRQPILLESESMCRDSTPKREKGKRLAGFLKGGSGKRGWPDPSDGNGGGLVEVAGTLGRGFGDRGGDIDGHGAFVPESIAHTLNADGYNDRGDGSENQIVDWPAEIAQTLDSQFGNKQGLEDQHIRGGQHSLFHAITGGFPDVSSTITTNGDSHSEFRDEHGLIAFDTTQITSKTNRSNPQVNDPCHTLAKGSDSPAIAFRAGNGAKDRSMGESEELCPTLPSSASGTNLAPTVAYSLQGSGMTSEESLGRTVKDEPVIAFEPRYYTRDNKTGGQPSDTAVVKEDASKARDSSPHAATGMKIRRLTPVECSRLQGVDDHHLNVLHNGKPLSDSLKYRLIGNGFAVPVVKWLGKRFIG